MGYRIRQIDLESQFCQNVSVDVISEVIGMDTLQSVLDKNGVGEQRVRKLPALLTLLLCIMMNLLSDVSLSYVLVRMLRGTRFLCDVSVEQLAKKSAISRARYRLGAVVMQSLFQEVCRPIATEQTQGAFAYGLRLVAIDGTVEDLADTPDNEAFFGRHYADRGAAAFPQAKMVYLCECGTHVIFDVCCLACHKSEHKGAKRVLRSVEADMLVMMDRGLYSYEMVSTIRQKQAHVLCRLSASVKPKCIKKLPDGSYLAYIYPSDYHARRAGERLLVRVITYTIDDPNRPGHAEIHRLLTTLLESDLYPAIALIDLYHERWEIEITIDEIDSHQRLLNRPFRSLKVLGVIQELYGLLLAHFVVRYIMHEAAVQAAIDPDRLSFINSVRLICDAVADFQLTQPEDHPRLWQRLLQDIRHFQLPPRENRTNPRVIKRKMSKFRKKRPEHLHPPKPKPFLDSLVLLQARHCA